VLHVPYDGAVRSSWLVFLLCSFAQAQAFLGGGYAFTQGYLIVGGLSRSWATLEGQAILYPNPSGSLALQLTPLRLPPWALGLRLEGGFQGHPFAELAPLLAWNLPGGQLEGEVGLAYQGTFTLAYGLSLRAELSPIILFFRASSRIPLEIGALYRW
jgi:hypothetical protein